MNPTSTGRWMPWPCGNRPECASAGQMRLAVADGQPVVAFALEQLSGSLRVLDAVFCEWSGSFDWLWQMSKAEFCAAWRQCWFLRYFCLFWSFLLHFSFSVQAHRMFVSVKAATPLDSVHHPSPVETKKSFAEHIAEEGQTLDCLFAAGAGSREAAQAPNICLDVAGVFVHSDHAAARRFWSLYKLKAHVKQAIQYLFQFLLIVSNVF
jgi:hypothetical protein